MKIWILLLSLFLVGCDSGGKNPSIPKCSATVFWETPNTRYDGTELTLEELKKFTIYINRSSDPYNTNTLAYIIDITNVQLTSWDITDIKSGMYSFYMTVTDKEERISPISNVIRQFC